MAYLAWPVALYGSVGQRSDASNWYRLQMRQALWFGNLAGLGALFALAWPLIVSAFIGNATAVLWLYGVAIALDIALFVLWLILAMRYSQAAARGELFEIPLVSRIAGTATGK
jgi:uncharacterized membrane protein